MAYRFPSFGCGPVSLFGSTTLVLEGPFRQPDGFSLSGSTTLVLERPSPAT